MSLLSLVVDDEPDVEGSDGLAAEEDRDVENLFLDRIAHRRSAAVRIEALRSRVTRTELWTFE